MGFVNGFCESIRVLVIVVVNVSFLSYFGMGFEILLFDRFIFLRFFSCEIFCELMEVKLLWMRESV